MNNLIKDALLIPVSDPRQTISINPVILKVEDRPIPLELRVTAPVTGDNLPVVLLPHGHGPSLYLPSKDGYGPLVNFYAEHGFAVTPSTARASEAGSNRSPSTACVPGGMDFPPRTIIRQSWPAPAGVGGGASRQARWHRGSG